MNPRPEKQLVEDNITLGLDAPTIRQDFEKKLFFELAKFREVATTNDCYLALAYTIRDRLLQRWVRSARTYLDGQHRTVLYLSAEYLMAGGNYEVILCERGIRTFETYTRNTMDISAIPVVKKLSHLPMVGDPSHGVGIRDKVAPMARAAVAAGADGLLIEVHHDPDHALSDGAQSLYPDQFIELMGQLRMIATAVGRSI